MAHTVTERRDDMLNLHTLEARDNCFLDVVFEDEPELRGQEMRRTITETLKPTIAALDQRGVKYSALRSALTPQLGKKEIALIFDSSKMGDWYGYTAALAVIPSLNRNSNHSILTGDIICHNQDLAMRALNESGTMWRQVEIFDTSQLYCVYINNLSSTAFDTLIKDIIGIDSAIGYIDCTFSSTMKSLLAICIGSKYLKVGTRFITSHPDDCEPDTNENAPGWPVEDFGYTCWSVDDMSFDLFLRYKVESMFTPMAFNDGSFSLAAIAGVWRDPRDLQLTVDSAKLGYLASDKSGSLSRAGLAGLSTEDLASRIRQRLAQSYIFSLCWNSDKHFSNFATIIELNHNGQDVRMRAVLKYENERLGLVSLF